MFGIDNGTQAASPPAIPAAGTPGYFQQGLPGTSTVVSDWWCNQVQQELLNLLTTAALSPVKTAWTQVQQAARRIAGANVTSLSANATLTADSLGLVEISAAATTVTVTLPAAQCLAAGVPARLRLWRTDSAGANSVVIARAGSDALAGGTATSFIMAPGEQVELISDGAASWLVRRSGPSPWTSLGASSGNFVVPAGYSQIEVEGVGPGGGGGGASTSWAGGGGGAGGGFRTVAPVAHGTSLTFTVGSGGAAGASGANGSPGNGNTTLTGGGLALAATAGNGGLYGTSPTGGAPGGASGATENVSGGYGGDGSPAANTAGGNGGASLLGGGSRGSTVAGLAAGAPGSGGGAGYYGNVAGNPGADGRLRYRFLP